MNFSGKGSFSDDSAGKEVLLCRNSRYLVKLAENRQEQEQALQLRSRVFRQEQGKLALFSGSLEQDEYDRFYRHLVVISLESGAVVGTYRVGFPEALAPGMELYSQREFRISGLETIRERLLEVGRSCVAPEFRSGAAVALLWSGLAELCRRRNRSYLLGCASFDTDDAASAESLYQEEKRNGRLSSELSAEPMPEFLPLPCGDGAEREGKRADSVDFRRLPPLVKGYLRLGGRICSPPAWDREFGSIDLLVCCNLKQMTEKYAHHFHLL